MALTDYDAYLDAMNSATRYAVSKQGPATGAQNGRWSSPWTTVLPDPGTAPTTAVAPTSATAGALLKNYLTTFTNSLRLSEVLFSSGDANTTNLMLIDRLSHQGGLSGTSTAAQTTNLPTAALTRYTSGEGVVACLEIYGYLGATATLASVSYTNSAGTSGRTSKQVAIGLVENTPERMLILPLQDGDTGVRSVESVTLLASTGTVGNFGVTLFKPLLVLPNIAGTKPLQDYWSAVNGGGFYFPEIQSNACLQLLATSTYTSYAQTEFTFIEV